KIVVTGGTVGNFAVSRFGPTGTPDSSFGIGGTAIVAAFPNGNVVALGSEATALALQPDGKIVAVGDTSGMSGSIDVARLNADGKIVAAGAGIRAVNTTSTAAAWVVGGFNADGSLDTSFGTSGFVTQTFGNSGDPNNLDPNPHAVHGLVLQPDGKIVAAGN